MDTALVEFLNGRVHDHPLLVAVVAGFAHWGVLAFGVAACGLWLLDEPRKSGVWRHAAAYGLAAAALALLVNQVVARLWERPRPYADHAGIVPLLAPSHDPSFPSDHAAAAFGLAVGVFLVHRRAGWLFLAWASLIAVSRVVAGMHYPSDVLAGAAIGAVSAVVVVRLAHRPVQTLVRLAAAATDPALIAARRSRWFASTAGSPAVRRTGVLVAGAIALAVFAHRLQPNLLDELPVTVLALWALVVAGAARIAGRYAN